MLNPAGTETVLYSFTGGADGGNPWGGVVRDAEGNLYGTTFAGGTAGLGCVFKLDASGNETVLHSFTGGSDGSEPMAGVIRDKAGNLFGTTFAGGDPSSSGIVFKLDAAGNETILHRFRERGDGTGPQTAVIPDGKGNLYGTTSYGGSAGKGVVYEVAAGGHETVLRSFTGNGDGGYPNGPVTLDAAGNLYGTTGYGGASNEGVVFVLNAARQLIVLYSFSGGADGGLPDAGVIRDAAGDLFGTALQGGAKGGGVVFKVAGQ